MPIASELSLPVRIVQQYHPDASEVAVQAGVRGVPEARFAERLFQAQNLRSQAYALASLQGRSRQGPAAVSAVFATQN